jgi:hypothetical protein
MTTAFWLATATGAIIGRTSAGAFEGLGHLFSYLTIRRTKKILGLPLP